MKAGVTLEMEGARTEAGNNWKKDMKLGKDKQLIRGFIFAEVPWKRISTNPLSGSTCNKGENKCLYFSEKSKVTSGFLKWGKFNINE